MRQLFTLCCAILMGGAVMAQIPNSGFETWTTTGGYDVAAGWDNLNAMTARTGVYTCVRDTPGNPGASYIKLTSKTVPGMGVVPGVAVSGVMDTVTYMAKSGFAYAGRPDSLTGAWQYMAFGSDRGFIAVLLTKWDSAMHARDTISFTIHSLNGMLMSWTRFAIPIIYNSPAMPDTAIIVLSASGSMPVNSSFLYVDNLAFTNAATTAIPGTAMPLHALSLYPNPATGSVTVVYNSKCANTIAITVSDMSGRNLLMLTPKTQEGENKYPITTKDFAKGVYSVKITDGANTQVQQLVIE